MAKRGIPVTLRTGSRSTTPLLRAALAAAMALTLGACAGGIDTKPDKPFSTTNVCTDSAVPNGWIRTNDWRAKGCGVEENEVQAKKTASAKKTVGDKKTADDKKTGVQKASMKVASAKAADPSADNNNWMTITEVDRVRVGRSLTACVGGVPAGWVETTRYWDKGRCGNPLKSSVKNVMLIERVK